MDDHSSLGASAPSCGSPPDSQPSSVPACAICGEWDFSPNVEAFEVTDELMCDDCYAEMGEANAAYEREDAE